MRKSSKREYERVLSYGMDFTGTAFVKKTTHRAVRRKLNNQTKRLEQTVNKMQDYSDTDMNYQKGL